MAIRLIKTLISRAILGRPVFWRRDFQRRNALNPWRCHLITVAGLTMTSTSFQFAGNVESVIHNNLVELEIFGFFFFW